MERKEYNIQGIAVKQQVRVEPVHNPSNSIIFEVAQIGQQVVLHGPGHMKLAVDIENFMRDGTDRRGTLRFVPLEKIIPGELTIGNSSR